MVSRESPFTPEFLAMTSEEKQAYLRDCTYTSLDDVPGEFRSRLKSLLAQANIELPAQQQPTS